MAKKFYRVKKENFLWDEGAILENTARNGGGYEPVNDIWKKFPDSDEYITDHIIENSPEYFERVYEVSLGRKVVYKVKDKAKKLLQKEFETKEGE